MPCSTLAPTEMASSEETASSATEREPGQSLPHRLRHLGLVLWVSLSMPIVGSAYYMFGGTAPTAPGQQSYRLWGSFISEATSLLVLWYVMGRQGKAWKDIGWT